MKQSWVDTIRNLSWYFKNINIPYCFDKETHVDLFIETRYVVATSPRFKEIHVNSHYKKYNKNK